MDNTNPMGLLGALEVALLTTIESIFDNGTLSFTA